MMTIFKSAFAEANRRIEKELRAPPPTLFRCPSLKHLGSFGEHCVCKFVTWYATPTMSFITTSNKSSQILLQLAIACQITLGLCHRNLYRNHLNAINSLIVAGIWEHSVFVSLIVPRIMEPCLLVFSR